MQLKTIALRPLYLLFEFFSFGISYQIKITRSFFTQILFCSKFRWIAFFRLFKIDFFLSFVNFVSFKFYLKTGWNKWNYMIITHKKWRQEKMMCTLNNTTFSYEKNYICCRNDWPNVYFPNHSFDYIACTYIYSTQNYYILFYWKLNCAGAPGPYV